MMNAPTQQFLLDAGRAADRHYDLLAERLAERAEAEFQLAAAHADSIERGRIPVTFEQEDSFVVPVRVCPAPGLLFDPNPKPI